jgi:hypothetical protein
MRLIHFSIRPGLVLFFLSGFFLGAVEVRGGEGHTHCRLSSGPSNGYAVPLQRVYQFPAAMVSQPSVPIGYAVPLQHVYQFPAALVFQPGPELPFGGVWSSAYDQYAGPAFIPR